MGAQRMVDNNLDKENENQDKVYEEPRHIKISLLRWEFFRDDGCMIYDTSVASGHGGHGESYE